MPTKASRARRWIKEGKAKPIRTKLGIFGVQLLVEPSGRGKQPTVIGIDPGSKYTGIAVVSKRSILCGYNLELPDYIKGRMDKRRELRRNRRHRKCRRRECRFLNRTRHKIAPSILARKQLELKAVTELAQLYPIITIAIEDVRFNHYTKQYGKFFSQVEVGKNWLVRELRKIAAVEMFNGWQTSVKRKELGLKKSSKKDARIPEAHVSDAVSLCGLILNGPGIETQFEFDILRRPKYSRRKLHLEQPGKGGIRRQYGGTTTPFVFRKGDYVEATQGKRTVRGWVSGYTKKLISVADFDWKRLGQFAVKKVRLLERNSGVLLKSKEVKKGEFLHPTCRVVSFA
ncbi:MAG: RRXRR domain-containing protein [Methanomicrobia archaeon]|nr:RRXRR domain-containing protein [Methanomicrobia archaeon]